jgi:hypothetical protein
LADTVATPLRDTTPPETVHTPPALSVKLVAGGIVVAPLELPDELLEPLEDDDELDDDELELLLELDDDPPELLLDVANVPTIV